MEEQKDALSEQTIGEEFALQLEQANKQVAAEKKMTAELAREKRKAKQQEIKKQEDILKSENKAPETISVQEQFKSLGKGDIAGIEEEAEKPPEDEEKGHEEETLAPQAPAENKSRAKSAVEYVVPAVKNLRVRKEVKKRIREVNKDIKNLNQQIGQLRGQLRPAQSAYAASRSADTMRVIKNWLKIVGAAYITIIFGVILTLLSIMIIPFLLVIGATGIFPPSAKSKKLKAEMERYREQMKVARKKIIAKNRTRQLLYRQLT